jgi:hypothetical protein
MSKILYLKTISDLYKFLDLGYAEHPLIAVVDFNNVNMPKMKLESK